MASKQTRKSISITGDAYWALKARCDKDGATMSGVAERLIREFLEMSPRERDVALAQVPVKSSPGRPAPRPYVPARDIEAVLKEVVAQPVKVDRAELIRAVADRIESRKEESVKQVGVPLTDMASKIFTF